MKHTIIAGMLLILILLVVVMNATFVRSVTDELYTRLNELPVSKGGFEASGGDDVLALEGAPPGTQPEQQVLDTLGAEELTRMILDLREPYKTPCRLVLLEQHTMAEAARLCGRPEKTVNAQIYRAKKMLVQQIREQQEGRSVHGTV